MQLKIESSLLSLLDLKNGWHFGEGASISEDSVLIAVAITRRFEGNKDIKYIESFPTLDGYVNLQIKTPTGIIGMLIESEKNIEIYKENNVSINSAGTSNIENIIKIIEKEIKNGRVWIIIWT